MGVDDGLAFAVAARLPDVRVVAVSTVFGNVGLPTVTRNALLFRELLHADWPVFVGAAGSGRGDPMNAQHIHGDDGLGQVTLDPTLADIVDAASRADTYPLAELRTPAGPVTILGIGPATNIRTIVERYGREHVAQIVLMTGVFFDRGNVTATAEFNAACDPDALRETIALDLPLTLVPLDVCRKVQLSRETVRDYGNASPLARVLVGSHRHYMDQYRRWEGIEGCIPHDAVALLAAVYPDRFWRVRGRVDVASDGTTRLVSDPRSAVQVVTGGDLLFVRDGLRTLEFTSHSPLEAAT